MKKAVLAFIIIVGLFGYLLFENCRTDEPELASIAEAETLAAGQQPTIQPQPILTDAEKTNPTEIKTDGLAGDKTPNTLIKRTLSDCKADRKLCLECSSYKINEAVKGSRVSYRRGMAEAYRCANLADRPDIADSILESIRATSPLYADKLERAEHPGPKGPRAYYRDIPEGSINYSEFIRPMVVMMQRGRDAAEIYKGALEQYMAYADMSTKPESTVRLLADAYLCAEKLGDTYEVERIKRRLYREAENAGPEALLEAKTRLEGYDAGKEIDKLYSNKKANSPVGQSIQWPSR